MGVLAHPLFQASEKMIDEEATFKKFGYYARDLAPKSGKKCIAVCDGCGKIREARKASYNALCKSCCRKGESNPFWGKHRSEETKRKIGKAQEGEKSYYWKGGGVICICPVCGKEFKRTQAEVRKRNAHFCSKKCRGMSECGEKNHNWQGGPIKRICIVCGKEFYIKRSKVEKGYGNYCSISCAVKVKRRHQKFPTHHTKPERIFESICKKNKLPFKYTGDSSFWIHNINPDFVECNGGKIAVEVFGDYWHSPLLNYKLREDRTLPYRKKILKKYGWKLIIFWETDLLREDAEAFVLKTLEKKL